MDFSGNTVLIIGISISYIAPMTGDCELSVLDISGRLIDRATDSPGDGVYP